MLAHAENARPFRGQGIPRVVPWCERKPPMKKGDDPTDPGPPPDVDPGPAPEPAPQPMPWEPPIDDPEIVAMLKGLKDGSWALDPATVPTTDGDLAAKYAGEAREPPSPHATPKPEDNVILWRTGDGPILRESPRRDAAEEGVERTADRETVLLPGRRRRRLAVVVAGVLGVSATIVAAALLRQGSGEQADPVVATATAAPSTSTPTARSTSTATATSVQTAAPTPLASIPPALPVEFAHPATTSAGTDNPSPPGTPKPANVSPRVTRPTARPAPTDKPKPAPVDPTKALLPDQP
jgi:hypothetical protein